MRTSTDLEKLFWRPRMPTAQVVELSRPTSTPGASRRASAIEVAPARRISSAVITYTADGVSHSSVGHLFAVTTSTLPSCSRESFFSCFGFDDPLTWPRDEESPAPITAGVARTLMSKPASTRAKYRDANIRSLLNQS